MGLLEKIFPNRQRHNEAMSYFKTLTAYAPTFRTWNGAIYESERVRAAIDSLARHSGKLQIELTATAQPYLQTRLKKAPNTWQTWYQFCYQARTILETDTTLFIVPVFDNTGRKTGIYPLSPSSSELVEWHGVPYVKYHFKTGEIASIELSEVGILTKFQYDKEFFGSGNKALVDTMQLINLQNQGIAEAVKNGATFRFMATLTNFTKDDDVEKEKQRFNRTNLQGEGGGLLLFNSIFKDPKQIDSKPFVIDAEQMNLIDRNIYNYFGTNENIIQGKASGDDFSAFYESSIEPFAIQLSEVLTKMLFTEREQGNGSNIAFTTNRLQFMTNKDKLDASSQLLDRGVFSINDVRAIWNLPPVDGGDTRIIRGEYYNADDKINDAGENGGEDEKDESND